MISFRHRQNPFFLFVSVLTFGSLVLNSCRKEDLPSAPPVSISNSGETEYRFKYVGTYKGTLTKWYFSMGSTSYQYFPDFVDSVYMDRQQDSVIIIRNYSTTPTNFTINAAGSGTVSFGFKVYGNVNLRNDSLFYDFKDVSALGGAWGYYLQAKKAKP